MYYEETDFRCPDCGEGNRYPGIDSRCTCRGPLWIAIPAGQHIHINCPVHGDRKIYGPPIMH